MTATTAMVAENRRSALAGILSRHAMLAAAILLCLIFVLTSPVFGTSGNAANILREVQSAEVVIAGGVVRHADGGVVGEAAVDFIRQFRVDYAVIGASAIDADGTLLDFDFREVKVAQAIIETARKTILVADAMKFERTAPVRIGHLEQIDVFVTDQAPSPAIATICAAAGVELHIASEGPTSK